MSPEKPGHSEPSEVLGAIPLRRPQDRLFGKGASLISMGLGTVRVARKLSQGKRAEGLAGALNRWRALWDQRYRHFLRSDRPTKITNANAPRKTRSVFLLGK